VTKAVRAPYEQGMTSRITAVLVGLSSPLLLAGFGDTSHARADSISVRIRVTTYAATVRHVHSFSLGCNPTGGSLPLAGRVCRDISLHRKAMLNPPKPRWTCAGPAGSPTLTVTTSSRGATHTFGGEPGCDWPVGPTIEAYWAAIQRDEKELGRVEQTLRCEEDPALLARPTPLASAVACTHGLWTPRSEQLIQLAEKAPALAALQPSHLFPHDIGAVSCTIHAGGFVGGRKLLGLCGVTMKNVWSKPTVSFTEDWPSGAGKTARHIWHVVLQGKRVIATTQSGPVPPQLRR
jgi:hypothetical protein